MVNQESLKLAGYLENLDQNQLMNALRQPPPGVPLYLVMGEQMRRQNLQQQAMAQPKGPQPTSTVADDLMQSGIASTPEMSMGGVDNNQGIASFSDGGRVSPVTTRMMFRMLGRREPDENQSPHAPLYDPDAPGSGKIFRRMRPALRTAVNAALADRTQQNAPAMAPVVSPNPQSAVAPDASGLAWTKPVPQSNGPAIGKNGQAVPPVPNLQPMWSPAEVYRRYIQEERQQSPLGVRGFAGGGRVDDDEDSWYRFGRSRYPSGGPGEMPDWMRRVGQFFSDDKTPFGEKISNAVTSPGAFSGLPESVKAMDGEIGRSQRSMLDGIRGVRNITAPTIYRNTGDYSDARMPGYGEPEQEPTVVAPSAPFVSEEESAPVPAPRKTRSGGGSRGRSSGIPSLATEPYMPREEIEPLLPQSWMKLPDRQAPQEFTAPALDEFVQRMEAYNPDALTPRMLAKLEKKQEALEEARAKAGPMALIQTGLAIAAGTSKNALTNIARGGIMGLNAFAAGQQNMNSRQDEIDEMEMKLLQNQQQHKMTNFKVGAQMQDQAFNQKKTMYDNAQENYRMQKNEDLKNRDFAFDVDKDRYGRKKDERKFEQDERQHRETISMQKARMTREDKQQERIDAQNKRAVIQQYNARVKEISKALESDPDLMLKPKERMEAARVEALNELDGESRAIVSRERSVGKTGNEGVSGAKGAQGVGMPQTGEVRNGYRFKGGNPRDKNNWEKV